MKVSQHDGMSTVLQAVQQTPLPVPGLQKPSRTSAALRGKLGFVRERHRKVWEVPGRSGGRTPRRAPSIPWLRSAVPGSQGAAPAPAPALPSLPGRRSASITSCRGLHEERCCRPGQGTAPRAARNGQPGRPGLLPAGLGQEGRRAALPGVTEEEIWYCKWKASVLVRGRLGVTAVPPRGA